MSRLAASFKSFFITQDERSSWPLVLIGFLAVALALPVT